MMETALVNESVDAQLALSLDSDRLSHCRRTADLTRRLALRHGVDEQRAHLVGLLHDCGKGQTLEFLVQEAAPEALEMDELSRETRPLHHAFAGAHLARTRFGVQDDEILEAIRYHPTGSPDFGMLGRILYLGDYLEPGRPFPDRDGLEALAFTDLTEALLRVIELRIEHLKRRGKTLHPRTLAFLSVVRLEKVKRS